VEWDGYPGKDSWEPIEHIQKTEALAQFFKNKKNNKGHKRRKMTKN
jgi:hypothetical protein